MFAVIFTTPIRVSYALAVVLVCHICVTPAHQATAQQFSPELMVQPPVERVARIPKISGKRESALRLKIEKRDSPQRVIPLPAQPTQPAEEAGDQRKPDLASGSPRKPKTKATKVGVKKGTRENPAVLAAQPKKGDHFKPDNPAMDRCVSRLPYEPLDFSGDAIYQDCPPDPVSDMGVYQGKHLNRNQRPLVEIGRPFYDRGEFAPSSTIFGRTNLLSPQFLVFGDWRTAVASNIVNGDHKTQIATRLNLDFDLKLTATERLHAFVRPFDRGAEFTRLEIDGGNYQFFSEFDFEFDTGFFEGDLGSIVGGMTGDVMPFDLPFSIGQIPLLLQNGLWLEDAFIGVAATIPAKNSRLLDISNMDTTFFFGFDNITSPVFQGDDNAAKMYGVTSFIEAMDGYFELGYTYLEDRSAIDRSYHNVGLAFTKRYGRLSNTVRLFLNSGQTPNGIASNAEGALLLIENSFVSKKPYTVVPYFNMFAGFGHPQSVARAGGTGGVLKNTGINFESDGMTNYPTLDDSGAEAFGGAVGLNLIADNFSHQLILEFAFLQTMGDDPQRKAVDDQYGVGARYQLPLSNSVILRADAMYGFFNNDRDVMGSRIELRKKF